MDNCVFAMDNYFTAKHLTKQPKRAALAEIASYEINDKQIRKLVIYYKDDMAYLQAQFPDIPFLKYSIYNSLSLDTKIKCVLINKRNYLYLSRFENKKFSFDNEICSSIYSEEKITEEELKILKIIINQDIKLTNYYPNY